MKKLENTATHFKVITSALILTAAILFAGGEIFASTPKVWTPEELTGGQLVQKCAPMTAGEEPVYQEDFKWGTPLLEMKSLFEKMYQSPKRLLNRLFWSEKQKQFILPIETLKGTEPAVVSETFIASVRAHLEQALQQGHADFGFFPDMGHNHFLIPDELWKSEYNSLDFNKLGEFYQKLFADSRVKMLYHTAEQLQMFDADHKLLPEKYIQYRYYTRNIVGKNTGERDLEVHFSRSGYNTVSNVPGYFWWGPGVDFHSNENGCFEYQSPSGLLRFDISNTSLPMKNIGNGSDDNSGF